MAHINLLPWREELRKHKQQEFNFIAGSAVAAAALLVLLGHTQMSTVIDQQNQRNQFLQTEIKDLDARIVKIQNLEKTKSDLLARMNIIQQLQHSRPQSVHLMDSLVATLPDGIFLNKIHQKGNSLTLSGVAQSNARVSAYMRNIDNSTWIEKPKLDVIESKKGEIHRTAEFILRAKQVTTLDDVTDEEQG